MSESVSPEPIHAVVSGVAVVTIPVAHYAELLEYRRRIEDQIASPPTFDVVKRANVDTRSRLFDDPEVAAFLIDVMGSMRLIEAHRACVERFGISRAPSRSAIGRFWQKRRGTR